MNCAYLDSEITQAQDIRLILEEAGHQCRGFDNSESLVWALERDCFDLLLMDWHPSATPCTGVLGRVRDRFGDSLPVLLLARRSHEDDVVAGLAAGAYDVVAKPARPRELIARMESIYRQTAYRHAQIQTPITLGSYRLDIANRTCYLRDEPLPLTPSEFDIAELLFRNMGRALSRERIRQTLLGVSVQSRQRTLDVHVSRLRNKLQLKPENGARLTAVYGHGYRLDMQADAANSRES